MTLLSALEKATLSTGKTLLRYQWHTLGSADHTDNKYTFSNTVMNKADVLKLVKAHTNELGIKHWQELGADSGLTSFGLGLTQVRKLAKTIGRNRTLATELWDSEVYELKAISLLIDDPKTMTREQAERQVEQLRGGMLAHIFSSCDATLAKTAFAVDLADQWIARKDSIKRQCGYGLLYEISKFSGKKAPPDSYFLKHIEGIAKSYSKQNSSIKMCMGGALMGIGKRNAILNAAALNVARTIGPVEQDNGCEPFDVEKHLVSPQLKKKLGIK